jgi:tetratricopeptide (TPR) repeat protein
VERLKKPEQSPVVTGKPGSQVVAIVDTLALKWTQAFLTMGLDSVKGGDSRGMIASPEVITQERLFFDLLKNIPAIDILNYTTCVSWTNDAIIHEVFRNVRALIQKNPSLAPAGLNMDSLQLRYDTSPDLRNDFGEAWAVYLHKYIQQIINAFNSEHEAQLQLKGCYMHFPYGYAQYGNMMLLAMNFLPKDSRLYRSYQVNYFYLTGLVNRINMHFQSPRDSFEREALKAQLQAFALEPESASINTELGILYYGKQDYATAQKYFRRAQDISPSGITAPVYMAEIKRKTLTKSPVHISREISKPQIKSNSSPKKKGVYEVQPDYMARPNIDRRIPIFDREKKARKSPPQPPRDAYHTPVK